MPTQACLDKIAAMPPPFNKPCPTICGEKNFIDNTHCSAMGYPPDTPFMVQDTCSGKPCWCYCCCSCFTRDTPLEQSPGQYVLVQDVHAGDHLMVCGADLQWKPGVVETSSSDVAVSRYDGMYLISYKFEEEELPRSILVSPDHLFMRATDRTLKAVQHLIAGDELMRNDGRSATVIFVARGSYETSLHTLSMEGEFDGVHLDGHLLNANGLVTTDYTVQAYYATHNINETLLFKPSHQGPLVEVGQPEYLERFPNPHLERFLADRSQWPQGFSPIDQPLVNVPETAKGFVIEGYAEQILKNGKFSSPTNLTPRLAVYKVFGYLRALNPGVIYLLDWNNPLPNAYGWESAGQSLVLVTGGLARLEGLFTEGLSLILSSVQARMNGAPCVGDADYVGMSKIMRDIWPTEMVPTVFPGAMDQVSAVLGLIQEPIIGNTCEAPDTACRMESFVRGISFRGVPECAKPVVEQFELQRAAAQPNLTKIVLTFSVPVEVATATTKDNYTLSPEVAVTDAQVSAKNNAIVNLTVAGLTKGTSYLLTVRNVLSAKGTPIDPMHDSQKVRMPQ
jgi:hypothetical protein